MIDHVLTTIEGVWLFMLRITETAPLGFWTFFIAAVVPATLTPRLSRALPESWHPASRGFIVETVALIAGIGLAWLPWQTLPGALVGIMGGLLSPYLTKAWMAAWGVIFRWWARRLGVEVDTTPQRRSTDNADAGPVWRNYGSREDKP
jgi:hypothetical protein